MELKNKQLCMFEREYTPEEKAVMYLMSKWKVREHGEEDIYKYYHEHKTKGLKEFLRTIYCDCGFCSPNGECAEYIGKNIKFRYGNIKGEMSWNKATELVAEMLENNTF